MELGCTSGLNAAFKILADWVVAAPDAGTTKSFVLMKYNILFLGLE